MTCTHTDATAPKPIPITIVYNFTHCDVYFSADGGYAETAYRDGTRVTAMPESSDEYRAKANRYGYGDDCNALSREHEFLHTFLAERLWGGASHALWAVAHHQEGYVAPLWEQEAEESLVLAFQQYLNGAEPAEALLMMERDYTVCLACLKDEAHRLLRRIPFPL